MERLTPVPPTSCLTRSLSVILNTRLANNGETAQTDALVASSLAIGAINRGTRPPPVKDEWRVIRP
jgi:hypothetical protein